jgi:hypothetical protein
LACLRQSLTNRDDPEKRLGVQAVNFAFGEPDLRTVLCCAHTSVYTLRVKVPGNPHPWYKLRGQ